MSDTEPLLETRERLRADVLSILRDKVEKLDSSFSGTLTEETRLFADLQFESVVLVEFCMTLAKHFRKKFPFQDLVFREGRFQDVSIGEIVTFLEGHLAPGSSSVS